MTNTKHLLDAVFNIDQAIGHLEMIVQFGDSNIHREIQLFSKRLMKIAAKLEKMRKII